MEQLSLHEFPAPISILYISDNNNKKTTTD